MDVSADDALKKAPQSCSSSHSPRKSAPRRRHRRAHRELRRPRSSSTLPPLPAGSAGQHCRVVGGAGRWKRRRFYGLTPKADGGSISGRGFHSGAARRRTWRLRDHMYRASCTSHVLGALCAVRRARCGGSWLPAPRPRTWTDAGSAAATNTRPGPDPWSSLPCAA